MKLLRLEFFKCRRRKVGWICLAFLAAQLLWVGYSIVRMEQVERVQGWQMTIYDLLLIDAVMLPITVGAIASRSGELEHKGNTWKLLETMAPAGRLFDAKLAWGALWIGGMLLCRTLVFLGLGLAFGFPRQVPLLQFGLQFLISFSVTLTIYLLQQSLSLLFRNQAVALVTSIVGSFAGLFSLFFPIWVQKCLLWGYYGVLNLAAMDWDPVTRATDFYWITVDKSGIVLLALWFVALLALGRTLFIRKEV